MSEKGMHRVRMLVVDDQALIVEKLRRYVDGQQDIEFLAVQNAATAIDAAIAFRPTVILQDLVMPEINGIELIMRYRETLELSSVPVVVLSSDNSSEQKEHCFAIGANDYLVKLPDRIELLARVRYHSRSYLNSVERDQAFHLLQVSQQQLSAANVLLQKLNGLDGLTGIANRRQFDEVMVREWKRALRKGTPLAVLMCDVDEFKRYNDIFGHVQGDLCLKRVAAVLTEQLKRPADLVARYGGEEFAIILPDTDLDGALVVAQACLQGVRNARISAVDYNDTQGVTISIGAASSVPSSEQTIAQLISLADAALYAAKRSGRDRTCGHQGEQT
jgi:two-component system chemotaxis family response regulator WspR